MGFFDFLSSKPHPEAPAPTTPAELLPSPRGQHYVMAHIVLRQVVMATPATAAGFLKMMEDPKLADSALQKLFVMATRTVKEKGEDTPLQKPKFTVRSFAAGGVKAVVVEMPTARAMSEAHFVAFASKDGGPVRYLTLELSLDFMTNQLGTMLCEWTGEGTHANFGSGPKAGDPKAFFDRCVALLG